MASNLCIPCFDFWILCFGFLFECCCWPWWRRRVCQAPMLISNYLETLQKDFRLHKELLQDGQDGLSCESKSIFCIFNGPFSVDVTIFTLFFVCNKTECQRCLSSASEKKTFEKENVSLWWHFNLQKPLNLAVSKALPYSLFSFTSAYYEFGVAHSRKSLKGLPFWDVFLK